MSRIENPESKVTRHGAMAVILSDDCQRVLLLRREIFILWELPGGGIEKGETGADAAVRETCEETGYVIQVSQPVGVYLHPSVYGSGDQRTQVFRGHLLGGTPKRFGLEISGLKWCAVTGLPSGLQPLHRQMITDALAGETQVARRIEFPRWQLFLARIAFGVMSAINKTIRRFL